jgi:fumarylacetoacetate (FAA) hydrolase
MKLATRASRDRKNRHGELIVVSHDNQWAVRPEGGSPNFETLLQALESWKEIVPQLETWSKRLNEGNAPGAFRLNAEDCLAPLPMSPGFYDGSAFLSHVVRARKSRGDVMPESAKRVPLMYQGVSDNLLPYHAPLSLIDPAFGGDFEGEFAVITDDVPRGTGAAGAEKHIALFLLFNDITYREIVKTELETKFGFLQSKPNSSFAPFAVTPDELGSAWERGRVNLDLEVKLNGATFGHPNGREMHFSFPELVAHACRTRPLSAGSIVGCGTVSNEDADRGFACLTEKRCQEIIERGSAQTPWLRKGDRVRLDVFRNGISVFGAIDQLAE